MKNSVNAPKKPPITDNKTAVNPVKKVGKQDALTIDGSFGEGGGQIIRTALALSVLTQTPIHIQHIRAGRKKSGLMRQHLVCVKAAQAISHAAVTGAELGSGSLSFAPQTIQGGRYHFDIGSAGSTSLVLQTLLPALLYADIPSTVTITGGTHNPLAPTADFLQTAFFPALRHMGIHIGYQLNQAGFAPVGGGSVTATITPISHTSTQSSASQSPNTAGFSLIKKTEVNGINLVASELNLSIDIAKREISSCQAYLSKKLPKTLLSAPPKHDNHTADNGAKDEVHLEEVEKLIETQVQSFKGIGEGNSCYAVVKSRVTGATSLEQNLGQNLSATPLHHQETFTLLGEKRTSAESIGKRLAGLVARYLHSPACVDEYLTDQLLLPLALTGGGKFTSRYISEHTRTQAVMIAKFLPVTIDFTELSPPDTAATKEPIWLVKVSG